NRTRNAATSTSTTLPSPLERIGDFSQSFNAQGQPVTIYDPTTGQPFPGNKIPTAQLNPIALSLMQYYPLPNAPGSRNNYQVPLTTVQNSDNLNTRLNYTLTKKDRINGGVGYQGSNSSSPNIFTFVDSNTGRALNANVAWSHNFSTRVISNLRYNFSRNR